MSNIEKENEMSIIKESDCYCICYSCDERLNIGDSIQYETSGYTTYCNNTECTEGVATEGTCLEFCWFGEDEDIEWEEEKNRIGFFNIINYDPGNTVLKSIIN